MQRLSAESAHLVLDALPQLAWLARADGFIFWYNRRWHEYTGTTPAEMEGWGWQSVHDPAALPRVLVEWQKSIATHEPFEMEFPLRGGDGIYRGFHTRANPVRDASGQVTYWVGSNTDVSTQKQLEAALRASELALRDHASELERAVAERTARLEDVVKELGTFSYSVAHDLRAPLRTIRGFTEVIQSDFAPDLPEAAQSYLARITRAAQRMDAMITDVLEYSRMSRAEMKLEPVNTEALLREVIETLSTNIPAGAEIQVVAPLPKVQASRLALQQCLLNLVGNGLKFVRPNVAPRVTVRAETVGGRARLWIEDNGIGIAPEYRERIWTMFERLNPGFEGTGVGLSIVRRAADRMGGKVGVESVVGEGSRFWIELPLAP